MHTYVPSSSSSSRNSHSPANQIFLAGLALQLASFLLFSILYTRFLWRIYKHEPAQWTQDRALPWYNDWRSLAGALVVSCIGILVSPPPFVLGLIVWYGTDEMRCVMCDV